MEKAQSTIIGFILITALAVAIISATLFWSRPLIERAQAQQEINNMEQKFIELHNAIKKVAAGQGSLSLPFDIQSGMIALNNNNNTINYEGYFDVLQGSPYKIIFGNNTPVTADTIPTTSEVVPLGTEEPGWLTEEGAITLNLHYRIVNASGTCYQIKLMPGQQAGAGVGAHTIRLTWLGENTTPYTGCSNNLTQQLIEFDVN
jgi:hypothetical protein